MKQNHEKILNAVRTYSGEPFQDCHFSSKAKRGCVLTTFHKGKEESRLKKMTEPLNKI